MKKLILASTALAVATIATPASAEIFEYQFKDSRGVEQKFTVNNTTGKFSICCTAYGGITGSSNDLKKWKKNSFDKAGTSFNITGKGWYRGRSFTTGKIYPNYKGQGRTYFWSDAVDILWHPPKYTGSTSSTSTGGSTSSTSTGGSTSSTSTGGSTSSTSTSSTSSTSTGGSTSSTSTGSSTSTSSTSTSSGGSTSSSSGGQVPAPGALLLFGLGAAGLIGGRKLAWRRRNRKA